MAKGSTLKPNSKNGKGSRGYRDPGQRIIEGNPHQCTGKAKYLRERQWARAEAKRLAAKEMKRTLMLAARSVAPASPAKRETLALLIGEEALGQAEQAVFTSNPHLTVTRDGPLVSSLAFLNATCKAAWQFFSSGRARLAHATKSGRVHWNHGLKLLLTIEGVRGKLASELATTPSSRHAIGLEVQQELDRTGTITITDADTDRYVAKLMWMRDHPEVEGEFHIAGDHEAYIAEIRKTQGRRALPPAPGPEEKESDAEPVVTFTGRKKSGEA